MLLRLSLGTHTEIGLMRWSLEGTFMGGILGLLALASEGFLQQNAARARQGARIGFFLGAMGGFLGFFFTGQLYHEMADQPLWQAVATSQRWLLVLLAIGIGMGIRDQSNLQLIRGMFSALAAGIFTTLVSLGLSQIPGLDPMILLLCECLTLGLAWFFLHAAFAGYRRREWLYCLNGGLENMEFELNKSIHYLGTQSLDQINLTNYPDINSTHAKLIRYYNGYSLVDNDPFGRTWVNFRNITEQPLKSGDIIKVGGALFQYLSLP